MYSSPVHFELNLRVALPNGRGVSCARAHLYSDYRLPAQSAVASLGQRYSETSINLAIIERPERP